MRFICTDVLVPNFLSLVTGKFSSWHRKGLFHLGDLSSVFREEGWEEMGQSELPVSAFSQTPPV